MYIYIACLPYYYYCYDLFIANLLIANIDFLSDLDDLRSKYIVGGDAGRYTTDSGLTANKDDNNTYNKIYIPPANIEKKEGSSSNNNSINSGTSDSANKGKGSSIYKHSKGALYCKDILLYKRQYVMSYPYSPPSTPCTNIYVYYV
ncbi:hypothetical protein P8C59_007598 [Phyllachora maydis]|uniref:Uncharacterized protein n=1 Tax=Phyllachora maydis TaxID=1825666 RepID=A0AAD9I8R0_9PEZI|nr:hypothetical protein P8C59_007598 [Phyllachora maydis]